ncbi:MAG: zinc ribbon domain-containing protein [Promethearchaeota archaeon]|nr:MAG: zinc ribbon domain-containing protein [Candidatus Lokiarchaeota archaeon]
MMMGEDPLLCSRCGQYRVVFYVKVAGIYAALKTVCPNDKSKKVVRLGVAERDKWIRSVTENIYRCTICGQPIPHPIKITRDGRWIVLHLECPTHGLKDAKRYILDTIYPIIENLHQNPYNVAAPSTFGSPSSAYQAPPPVGSPPPPPPDAFIPPPSGNAPVDVKFCSDCGAKLTPGALFCTSCGSAIEEDYDKY